MKIPSTPDQFHEYTGPYKKVDITNTELSDEELEEKVVETYHYLKENGLRSKDGYPTDDDKITRFRASKIILNHLWNDSTVPKLNKFNGLPFLSAEIGFGIFDMFYNYDIPIDLISIYKGQFPTLFVESGTLIPKNEITTLTKFEYLNSMYNRFLKDRVNEFSNPIHDKVQKGYIENDIKKFDKPELSFILFTYLRNSYKIFTATSFKKLFNGFISKPAVDIIKDTGDELSVDDFYTTLKNTKQKLLQYSLYHGDSSAIDNSLNMYFDRENLTFSYNKEEYQERFKDYNEEGFFNKESRIETGCPMMAIKGSSKKPALSEMMNYETTLFSEFYRLFKEGHSDYANERKLNPWQKNITPYIPSSIHRGKSVSETSGRNLFTVSGFI